MSFVYDAEWIAAMRRGRWGDLTLEERFWTKVDRRGADDCWEWVGHRNAGGYGCFSHGEPRRTRLAARAMVAFDGRVIPPGMIVLHTCDNPPCVNPRHLVVGTHADNVRDRITKGRTRNRPLLGEHHPNAKLTERVVLDIRDRHASGATATALAAEFGVAVSTMCRIVNRQKWRHVA